MKNIKNRIIEFIDKNQNLIAMVIPTVFGAAIAGIVSGFTVRLFVNHNWVGGVLTVPVALLAALDLILKISHLLGGRESVDEYIDNVNEIYNGTNETTCK